MSSVIENADRRLNVATESLRIAEERLNNFMNANPTDFTSAGYLTLSAEVTACREREERAQQTLQQTLAAQNRGKLVVSYQSKELLYISTCKLFLLLLTILLLCQAPLQPYPGMSDTHSSLYTGNRFKRKL